MKSRESKYLVIIILLFSSCNKREHENDGNTETRNWEQSVTSIEIIDTFQYKTVFLPFPQSKVSSYSPLYIGPFKDSVFIDYTFSHAWSAPPPPPSTDEMNSQEFQAKQDYVSKVRKPFYIEEQLWSDSTYFKLQSPEKEKFWKETDLNIFVDTNQIVSHIDFGYLNDQGAEFTFYAHPVFLVNPTIKYSQIGRGSHISLLLEIQDANGGWKKSEKHMLIFCDTGLPDLVIPPGELAISSVIIDPHLENNILRLRLGNNVSNEFSFN